jgi:YfaZ precursor
MNLRTAAILVLLSGATFAVQANNLDLNLGSNAAAVDFSANITTTGLVGDLGYLHHTDQVDIGSAGLQVMGDSNPAGSPFIFAVGGKLFFISPKQNNVGNGTVLGLGGRFSYTWPSYNRFKIGGELYYAPNIVSFNNADRYLQYSVNAGYEILHNADLYVGYRHISAAFTNTGTITLDNTFMVGFNLSF